jgi:hypothetical protein
MLAAHSRGAAILSILISFAAAAAVPVDAPADDAIAAAEALIRTELANSASYFSQNKDHRYYLLIDGRDPPADFSARLKDVGIEFRPGTQWKQAGDVVVGEDMMLSIGPPRPLPDGTFEIKYGFSCGGLCGAVLVATATHDAAGWRILASKALKYR